MLTMFTVMVGKPWFGVMLEVIEHSTSAAALFFISYTVIIVFGVLNLLLVVILDNLKLFAMEEYLKEFGGPDDQSEQEEYSAKDDVSKQESAPVSRSEQGQKQPTSGKDKSSIKQHVRASTGGVVGMLAAHKLQKGASPSNSQENLEGRNAGRRGSLERRGSLGARASLVRRGSVGKHGSLEKERRGSLVLGDGVDDREILQQLKFMDEHAPLPPPPEPPVAPPPRDSCEEDAFKQGHPGPVDNHTFEPLDFSGRVDVEHAPLDINRSSASSRGSLAFCEDLPAYDASAFEIWRSKDCRTRLRMIVESPWFERFYIFVICLNITTLVLLPKGPESLLLDIIFGVIFLTEIVFRCVVLGSMLKYLQSWLNRLDFIIVSTTIIHVTLELLSSDHNESQSYQDITHVFGVFRCLRPLRLTNKTAFMRASLKALEQSVKAVFNFAAVAFLSLLVFGIMGTHLFGGSFSHCNDPNIDLEEDCVGNFVDVFNITRSRRMWIPGYQFDNTGQSMYSLFSMTTSRGWVDIMQMALTTSGNGAGLQSGSTHVSNDRFWYSWYFVVWMLISNILFLRFFLGIIHDNIKSIQHQFLGASALSLNEKTWVLSQERLLDLKADTIYAQPRLDRKRIGTSQMTVHKIRKRAFQCAHAATFKIFFSFCVLLNVLIVSVFESKHMKEAFADCEMVLSTTNKIFAALFAFEMPVKLIAYFSAALLRDKWLQFEAALVIWGLLDACLWDSYYWRIVSIIRLVKRIASLRSLFTQLKRAMSALFTMAVLMGLILLVFAILGNDLYGHLPAISASNSMLMEHLASHPEQLFLPGGTRRAFANPSFLSENINFSTLPMTLNAIFIVSTGDYWNKIMTAVADLCHRETCIGGSTLPYVFFILVYALMNFFFLNLFVSVILEQFYDRRTYGCGHIQVTSSDIDDFKQRWETFEHTGKQSMPITRLPALLATLGRPFSTLNDDPAKAQYISDMFYERRGEELILSHREFGKSSRISVVANVPSDIEFLRAKRAVSTYIRCLDLPVTDDKNIQFNLTLRSIIYSTAGVAIPTNISAYHLVRRTHLKKAIRRYVDDMDETGAGGPRLWRHAKPAWLCSAHYTVFEWLAAFRIQLAWARYRLRLRLEYRSAVKNAEPWEVVKDPYNPAMQREYEKAKWHRAGKGKRPDTTAGAILNTSTPKALSRSLKKVFSGSPRGSLLKAITPKGIQRRLIATPQDSPRVSHTGQSPRLSHNNDSKKSDSRKELDENSKSEELRLTRTQSNDSISNTRAHSEIISFILHSTNLHTLQRFRRYLPIGMSTPLSVVLISGVGQVKFAIPSATGSHLQSAARDSNDNGDISSGVSPTDRKKMGLRAKSLVYVPAGSNQLSGTNLPPAANQQTGGRANRMARVITTRSFSLVVPGAEERGSDPIGDRHSPRGSTSASPRMSPSGSPRGSRSPRSSK